MTGGFPEEEMRVGGKLHKILVVLDPSTKEGTFPLRRGFQVLDLSFFYTYTLSVTVLEPCEGEVDWVTLREMGEGVGEWPEACDYWGKAGPREGRFIFRVYPEEG